MQADAKTLILAQGPVGYWDGAVDGLGNLSDATGGGRTLFPNGTPHSGETGADGVAASAVDIHGDSTTSDFWASSSYMITSAADQWTVSCWVYARVTPAGSGIMTDGQGGDGYEVYALGCDLEFGGDVLMGGHYEGVWAYASDSGSFPVGSWHHVAAVFDFGFFYLYLDGVLVGSSTDFSTGIFDDFLNLGYSDISSGALPAWPGLIDQPAVFDYALTGTQLQDQVDAMALGAGAGLSISPAGVATAFASGGAALKQNISAAGAVASGEAVGAAKLQQNISPGGLASAEAAGAAAALKQNISAVAVASGEAIGSATMTGGTPPATSPHQLPTLGVG